MNRATKKNFSCCMFFSAYRRGVGSIRSSYPRGKKGGYGGLAGFAGEGAAAAAEGQRRRVLVCQPLRVLLPKGDRDRKDHKDTVAFPAGLARLCQPT